MNRLQFVKKKITKLRYAVENPLDVRYLKFTKPQRGNGIVVVIHESNQLGASLLALHTAEELVAQGESVYIISRQFGQLDKKYATVAPLQIALTDRQFAVILTKLKQNYGFKRLLMITAAVGDLTKIGHDLGYSVVSEIHELASVIEVLKLQDATKQMLRYSDKVVFSTSIAKNEVLDLLHEQDKSKICIRPQGIYFKKADKNTIENSKKDLISKYPKIKDKKVVIGVGNTSERKGIDLFIKTARKVPECVFLWAGKRELYYNRLAKDLPNNFFYLGQMNSDQLSGLYELADVLLLSSRQDTLPSVILEAFLFHVPVIAARDSGGVIDIVNNSNGILTATASEADFSEAIKEMFANNKYITLKKDLIEADATDFSFSSYVSYIKNCLTGRHNN